MDVLKTIPPGQPGTQRFQRKYGERLVLVRYRHDAARQRRVTTVELIVDEAPFRPRRPIDREVFPHANRHVHVRVAYGESDLRQKIKEAGGRWDAEKKQPNHRYASNHQRGYEVTIVRISAVGTRGDAKGKLFIARKDSFGRYVLNRKKPSSSANPTNKAVNKVYASTLAEAARLLESDEYLINLTADDGKRALREFRKVRIDRA